MTYFTFLTGNFITAKIDYKIYNICLKKLYYKVYYIFHTTLACLVPVRYSLENYVLTHCKNYKTLIKVELNGKVDLCII